MSRIPDGLPKRDENEMLCGDLVEWCEGGRFSFHGYARQLLTGKEEIAVLHGHDPIGSLCNLLFVVPKSQFLQQFRRWPDK